MIRAGRLSLSTQPQVDILMSTFNGQKYLDAQLGSIREQSCEDWRLLIRDDGSQDDTPAVLRRAADEDPRIRLVASDAGNLGPQQSFMELLPHVQAPAFMFADQDDVWQANKIEHCLAHLDDGDRPCLVFTDLAVVNERLDLISPSFMRYRRLDPTRGSRFQRLAMQNVVTGCTMIGNRALLEASRLAQSPPPSAMIMHDWWLALVAAAFGELRYVNEPTVRYRQHQQNCIGAKPAGLRRYVSMLRHEKPWERARVYLRRVAEQAQAFHAFYEDQLHPEQKQVLESLSALSGDPSTSRLLRCFRAGSRMHAFDRNVALVLSHWVA